ncbi:C40 family peptidase [Streptomyces sp. NPDC018693]|uniref:C40 family peptidase n=1 Tax=unclassified Streptomyces TaxID=2593676 RepID=UPI0037B0B3C1
MPTDRSQNPVGAAHLDDGDRPSRAEIQRRVNALYDRAESDTGTFNATRAMSSLTRRRGGGGRGSDDTTLGAVARQWFDVARDRLGPTVPAALPRDRMPERPALESRPPRQAERSADATPGREPEAVERRVPELTARAVAALPAAPEVPETSAPAATLALPAAPDARTTSDAVSWPTADTAPAGAEPVRRQESLKNTKEQVGRKLSTARELLARAVTQPPVPAAPAAGEAPSAEPSWDTGELPLYGGGTQTWQAQQQPVFSGVGRETPDPAHPLASVTEAGAPLARTAAAAAPLTPITAVTPAAWTPEAASTATPTTAAASPATPTTAVTPPAPTTAAVTPPAWTPEAVPAPAPTAEAASLLAAPAPQPAHPAAPTTYGRGLPAPVPPGSPGPQALTPSYAMKADKAVAFARAQIGKPCVWGAKGPGSYDCSSLTQAAWTAAGVALPRAAAEQAQAGTPVELADLEPGDLVFFFDGLRHTGLYTGNGMMIHAPGPGAFIREESIYHAGQETIRGAVRPA